MKKHLLFGILAVLLLLGFRAEAQYSTPGTGRRFTLAQLVAASNGYVTQDAGAWLINDTIRLAPTDTLSINTNALVRVADRALLNIDGVLLITAPDSVVFTAQTPTLPWLGMRMSGTSAGSVLRRTVVERGGGVQVIDAGVEVTDCIFRNNLSSVGGRQTNSAALALSGSRALVQRCRFVRNARAGINSPSNRSTSPIIEDCIFWENDTENANIPQINLGVGNPAFPLRIERCLVVGSAANNMAGGIGISNLLGTSGVTNIIIRRNVVRNNRYGIALIGSNMNAYITGNVVENNSTNPNAQTGGSGFNFQGNQTQTGIVSRNVVRGNLWGVTMLRTGTAGAPRISFGNTTSTDTTDVGLNRFTGNGNGGQIYDFYNNSPDNIKAQNNDWGSASVAVIESHIFHQPDQATLGLVEYQPFRQPLTTRAGAAPLAAAAYPNPAHETVTFQVAAATPLRVQVLDATGRTVAAQVLQPSNGRATLDVRTLAPGLYAYRLEQADALATGKLVVQ